MAVSDKRDELGDTASKNFLMISVSAEPRQYEQSSKVAIGTKVTKNDLVHEDCHKI